MTASEVVIVGAGGHGREVADVAHAAGFKIAGFLDDGKPDERVLARRGLRVIGPAGRLGELGLGALIGIGDGAGRANLVEGHPAAVWAEALVHPAASIGSDVRLGVGTVVCAGARLTTNVEVGRHVYIAPNVVVSHDVVLEDFATVLPGATVSGNVTVERAATIGTGAKVIQGLTVGEGALVGAGAVVTCDVSPLAVVIGVPARPMADR